MPTKAKPTQLTSQELADIVERTEKALPSNAGDVRRLLENIEVLSDMLSDCWLVLDEVARIETLAVERIVRKARRLLKHQAVPGWKE